MQLQSTSSVKEAISLAFHCSKSGTL